MPKLRPLFLILLLSSACAAGRYQMVPRPIIVSAPGVDHTEDAFDGTGGVRLFEQSWLPSKPAKAVVVLVHGLKDHSTRYSALAQELVGHGFAVYAFDLRGHGSSEGDRVYIHEFDEYTADLGIFLGRVVQREPGKPVFLFGHSMGGAIATLYTINQKPDIKGLVLSAPALKPGSDISNFKISLTKFFATVTPTLAVMSLDLKKFSRDPEVVKDCEADPLIDQGNGPAKTAAKLLGALAQIQEHMGDVTVPLLIMHGSADVITNPEGSKELNLRARSTDKTLKIYDGLYHDLLHEPEKAVVTQDLIQWLDAHVPVVAPVPAAAPAAAH
jgi:acylglycerol lipase